MKLLIVIHHIILEFGRFTALQSILLSLTYGIRNEDNILQDSQKITKLHSKRNVNCKCKLPNYTITQ